MPENPHIQVQLAVVYSDLAKAGKTDEEKSAWDRLNRALLLQPDLVEALLLKADLLLRRKSWLAAVEVWKQAMAEDPNSIRKPIAAYLNAHSDAFMLTDAIVQHPVRTEQRRNARRGKRLATLAGVAAFVVLCLMSTPFVSIASESSSTGATVASVIAIIFVISAFAVPAVIRTNGNRRSNRLEWEAGSLAWLQPDERMILDGITGDPDRLLNAAWQVAEKLRRREQEVRVE